MRTNQAARYARWSAAAAVLLTVVVAGAYLWRNWEARKVAQSSPPPVPAAVQQRSNVFSFSRVEKDRTIFTVRASRATAFKAGSKSLLEDVWITIYGRKGQRSDNIHTQSCDYIAEGGGDKGQVICAGKVQIDLQSAEDARRYGGDPQSPQAAAHIEHIETSNVSFDRETGLATTDRPVDFRFPEGEGRAIGVSYDSQDNVLRLLRDVQVTVRPKRSLSPQAGPPLPVTLTSGSLAYEHDRRLVHLFAPVRVQQGEPVKPAGPVAPASRVLLAHELTLQLDGDYHVRRVVAHPGGATPQVELRSAEARGRDTSLHADEFEIVLNRDGWAERAQANGSVQGTLTREDTEDRISAAKLELQFVPRENQPEQVTATGNVVAITNRRGRLQRLDTSALRLNFTAKGPKGRRELDRGETLAVGTFEWQIPGAPGQPPREVTRITGRRLNADFGSQGRLANVAAKNGVSVERRLPEKLAETTGAREAAVRFDEDGEWTEVSEEGGVQFHEGQNAARGEHAKIDRASDTLTLSGSAELSDGAMRLSAESVTFNQRTAEFRADGSVRSTSLKSDKGSVANFASQPAFLIADHLQGNSSGGRALYSGHARLWQGDSVIEADSIELLRDAQRLTAHGNVAAAFIQAAGTSPIPVPQRTAAVSPAGRPELWRIRSGTLTYWSAQARALLEGGVIGESSQAGIASKSLELFFGSPAASAADVQPASTTRFGSLQAFSSALQLQRALASGNVVVRQGDRRGTADRAVYSAADQKFVLSGGNPTIYDGSKGITTGRELTFFFASDTILIDSEEGLRTLTKHRVEK